MSKRPSNTFCVLPWLHRFTNIGGEVQVCCSSEEFNNNILDDNGQPIDFFKADDAQIMNSNYMKELRKEMVAGKWPKICERCKITEDTGGHSRRQSENANFEAEIPRLMDETNGDGSTSVNVMSIDFRLGNLCNLSCRMCSPRSSSRWVQEVRKAGSANGLLPGREHEELKVYDWYKSPQLIEQLKGQLPTLRHLHFAGGEPLIVPEMQTILKACIDSGYADQISLTYNTNITRVHENLKQLWPKFAGVRLFCSIDGFGAINDYIRGPAKWKDIDANLRDLDANFETYGIKQILFSATVQIYNILYLEDLYEYAFSFKNIDRLPQLTDLYYPEYYRTQVLPPDLKLLAKRRLEAIIAKAERRLASGEVQSYLADRLGGLRGAIAFMEMENRENLQSVFRHTCLAKDFSRKQDLLRVAPELRPLIDVDSRFANFTSLG